VNPWIQPAPWSVWERPLLSAIALLGLILRLVDYTVAPDRHDNPDELQFAWVGMSVLRGHAPTSWSYLPQYHPPAFLTTPDGLAWPLVSPWFDHPPLFGLLVGAAALLAGAADYASVTTAAIRLPSILLATACIPLGFVLARRVSGRVPAFLGSAIFATAPVAVLYGRSVEPEALLAPLLLVALVAVHRLLTGEGGRGTLAVLLACCFLAPLAKVPGVAVGGTCAVVLLARGRPRAAAAAMFATLLGLLAFAAYGAAYDWGLFVAIFREQAAHRLGVMGAVDFISDPVGLNRRLRDGWWLAGWLAVGIALFRSRSSPAQWLLAWPAVAYAATMLVMADDRVTVFGWYRITIYPLIYLAAGGLVQLVLRSRPSVPAVVVVFVTGGASAGAAWLSGGAGPNIAAVLMTAVIAVLVVANWRPDAAPWQAVARVTARAAVLGLLVGNVAVSLALGTNYLRL